MSNELHWGGINVKSLIKAVVSDIWMVFAVMVITYLGLGIVGNMRYTPSYTSGAVVAVYPFNKMYTLEASSDALATVGAANEVFNSEMFRTGLNDRLTEPADFSLYSRQIDRTYILMLSASSSTPENAYQTLRTALDYYGEISSHLVGDNHLEILSGPDFPLSASNDSRILRRRPLLTLFMGFAMGCFLVLVYVMRKTYKTPSAIRRYYKDVRFFRVKASASGKGSRKNKKKSGGVPNQEAMRKTALELLQMLRAKNGRSILVTSAAPNEGKTEIIVSLAGEMAALGKSVIIMETDSEKSEISEQLGTSDQRIKVVFANEINAQDDFRNKSEDIEKTLEQTETLADVILVDGGIWNGSRDELIWKKAADTALAICRQDKADFYAIDQMMTDLQEDNPDFVGCVLYGF